MPATFQANEATLASVFKEEYPGIINEQLNNELGPLTYIEKQKVNLAEGHQIIEPLHVGRNQSIGSRLGTDRLPGGGNQRMVSATINMASTYITGEITNRVIRRTYTDASAFANALDIELRLLATDITNDLARQVATGDGVLCQVNGATTSSTTFVATDVSNLGLNMRIVFFNGASEETTTPYVKSTDAGGALITAINPSTLTVTLNAAQTLTTLDKVYRAGNFDGTTVLEMQGLDTIIANSGTYFGVSRSTEFQLQSNVSDMSGTFSEDIWQQAEDATVVNGGTDVDMWYVDMSTRRKFISTTGTSKRFLVQAVSTTAPIIADGVDRSVEVSGLSGGASFNGHPIVASRRIRSKIGYGLRLQDWVLFQPEEVTWVPNGENGVLHSNLVNGYDSSLYALYYDGQLFCRKPNSQTKIKGTN